MTSKFSKNVEKIMTKVIIQRIVVGYDENSLEQVKLLREIADNIEEEWKLQLKKGEASGK